METYNEHTCNECKINTSFDYYDENKKGESIIQRYCTNCVRLVWKD